MLQLAVDRLVYSVFGLDPASRWAQALDFFLYDSIKIVALLFFMIAAIGFARTYLPLGRLRRWLGRRKSGYFFASLFGAVTPFCSCSSIPLFIGFLRAGIPLGVSFAFLITSPLINEYLVVLMLGFFGPKVTILYVAAGMAIGISAGAVLGRMGLEKHLEPDMVPGEEDLEPAAYSRLGDRAAAGVREAASIVRKLWIWVLAGVAAGAVIHNYVPQSAIQGAIAKTGFWSVPLVTLLGVPLYGSCAAIVPVAVVLFQKGVPLGTALSFMMAVAALSLPEAIMLRRAMKLPLIAIFFAVTAAAIMIVGYVFNAIG